MKTRTGKDGTGRYYIVDEQTGLAYPSVTTILSETGDKSGLSDWVKRVGQEEADRISAFSANRGTYMHALHEQYINAKYLETHENPLQIAFQRAKQECLHLTPEEIECGKNLFFNFLNRSEFYNQIGGILFQEKPVWMSVGGGFAGRLDLAITGLNGKAKMIDFKTSRKPKQKDWITNYFKQISAYSIAMWSIYGIKVESAEIWISCETGEVQTFTLTFEEVEFWFREFYKQILQYHELHKNN